MKLTILIPTHAIKIEQIGPWKGMSQRNLCAPTTKLIEKSIESIKTTLSDLDLNFIVGLDHKLDDPISVEYLKNLKSMETDTFKVVSSDSALSDKQPTTVTATKNFFGLVDSCESELFLMWEHDWIFTRSIDTNKLAPKNLGVDIVRFNQFNNSSTEVENVWEQNGILFTDLYSNNPFITSKKFWQEKIVPIAKNVPNWWGEYGAFIEGPIKQYRDKKCKTEEGKLNYLNEYKICLYGNLNDPPSIEHLNGQLWKQI